MAKKKAAPRKDPKGGLTSVGRGYFKKKEGANLKPGVTKSESEMTPAEMKRKGSWAVRFYGRGVICHRSRRTASRPASR